jgi:hypothetical protein
MTRQEAISLVYGNPEAAVDLIFQLSEAVEILKARVAELERKIALLTRDSSNSSNSSKPPSSDGPGKKPQANGLRNPGNAILEDSQDTREQKGSWPPSKKSIMLKRYCPRCVNPATEQLNWDQSGPWELPSLPGY